MEKSQLPSKRGHQPRRRAHPKWRAANRMSLLLHLGDKGLSMRFISRIDILQMGPLHFVCWSE